MMDAAPEPRDEREDEQAAVWNGAAGQGWVAMQDVLDRTYEPLQDLLVEAVCAGARGPVLDVGCGTGGTTSALARRLGAGAECTGIDISAPMVVAARSRVAREGVAASFIAADAQRHPFRPASFDAIASRFGVMFFDDPAAAFANLRSATSRGGALRAIVWRSAEENPFMTTAERAAPPAVRIPAREPDGPGQFAFADERRVRSILEQAGWGGVDVQPIDVPCAFGEVHLLPYLAHLGPLARALAHADEATRARVVAAVRPAFDAYVDGTEVRFTAACWLVAASA
jgi:SAM-dependent methyltransferase